MFQRDTNDIVLSFSLDFIAILISLAAATLLRAVLPIGFDEYPTNTFLFFYIETILLYVVVFNLFSLYHPNTTFKAADEAQALGKSIVIAALSLAGLVYFTNRDISRLLLVYYYMLHTTLVILWRVIVHSRPRRHSQDRRVLVIGGGDIAQNALDRLQEMDWGGVNIIGCLTDTIQENQLSKSIPHIGTLEDASKVIRTQSIDDVLIALPAEAYSRVQSLLAEVMDGPFNCNIWVIPDFFSILLSSAQVADLGGIPMFSIKPPVLNASQRLFKRILDLVISILSLLPGLPLMGIISLLIHLDSPGPSIYRQQRVGENGRMFSMLKFRTMVTNAEERIDEVITTDEEGRKVYKSMDDPRITHIGHFLRRTSLDEIPQLFNVLRGEMSMVGPRPELPFLVEEYDSWQHKRFSVPQGITGWWQVNGRSDKPMHLHTEDDLYYIQNYSILLDIQILLRTILVVLQGRGAY